MKRPGRDPGGALRGQQPLTALHLEGERARAGVKELVLPVRVPARDSGLQIVGQPERRELDLIDIDEASHAAILADRAGHGRTPHDRPGSGRARIGAAGASTEGPAHAASRPTSKGLLAVAPGARAASHFEHRRSTVAREPKKFDHLLGGNAKGLSDTQLKAHFTLYQGYVKKLNEIREKLGAADRGAPNYSFNEYSELKRREPVAYNGTVLHEMYFENLGNGSTRPNEHTKRLIETSFGSMDDWLADAKAALMSAHGWLVVVFDYTDMKLYNNLVRTEHDVGLFANVHAMIAIDAWEHAYFYDYQTKKADYVANMLSGLNWDVVNSRLQMVSGSKPG
jgi:Fe-Mn family superoxide dismutase